MVFTEFTHTWEICEMYEECSRCFMLATFFLILYTIVDIQFVLRNTLSVFSPPAYSYPSNLDWIDGVLCLVLLVKPLLQEHCSSLESERKLMALLAQGSQSLKPKLPIFQAWVPITGTRYLIGVATALHRTVLWQISTSFVSGYHAQDERGGEVHSSPHHAWRHDPSTSHVTRWGRDSRNQRCACCQPVG